MEKKRLLFFIQGFDPFSGGMEKQANILRTELIKKGHTVDVLTFNYSLEDTGIISYRVPEIRFLSPMLRFLAGFYYLLKNIRGYDCVMSFLLSSNTLASGFLGSLSGVPVIAVLGGGRETGDIEVSKKTLAGRIKLFLIKKLVKCYSVPSSELSDEMAGSGFNKVYINIIYTGVETEKYLPVSFAEKIKKKNELKLPAQPIVLYVGRLHINKGIDDLLAAFSDANENAHLVLAGDGPERRRLERDFGSNDSMTFAGYVKNSLDFYNAADIFVLPSYAEGISNSLLEAMSSGLICIATRIGGNTEVIEHGKNGFLFEPGDRAGLKALIENVLKHSPGLAEISENARKTVLGKFGIAAAAEKYENIFENFCKISNSGKRSSI